MAYAFTGTQCLSKSLGSIITNWPLTLFARGRSTSTTTNQVLATFNQSSSPFNGTSVYFGGASSTKALFVRQGSTSASSVGAYSGSTWYAITGVSASDAVSSVALDAAVTSGSGSVAYPTSQALSDIQVGARLTPSVTQPLSGDAACIALWSVALTDAEINSLSKGFSPRRIRPQSLKFYAPLVRELHIFVSASSGAPGSLTITGTPTVSAHPRTYGY